MHFVLAIQDLLSSTAPEVPRSRLNIIQETETPQGTLVALPDSTGGGASSRGSHRLADVAQCPRKWYLRYKMGLVPREEPAYRFDGTLIHAALAYHYCARMGDAAPLWYRDEPDLTTHLNRIGEGYPSAIQNALDCKSWYEKKFASEPWKPFAVEEEFRVRLGDLCPELPDEPAIQIQDEDGLTVYTAPRLHDEFVTCRSDLVVEINGGLWIVDHKTKKAEWWSGQRDRLPKWKPDDWQVSWQGMINLHLVRHHLGQDRVKGFIIQRVKRDVPYDADRHPLEVSPLTYAQVPRVVYEVIKKEREFGTQVALGKRLLPHLWTCNGGQFGPCDYVKFCAASSDQDAANVLNERFKVA